MRFQLGLLDARFAALLEQGVLDERSMVQVFLVLERVRGAASEFLPWLALLPPVPSTPLFWDEQLLAELGGTTLHHATLCAPHFMP